jgi:hypothetical protein
MSAPDFAMRVFAERKMLADLDPAGEAEAVKPIDPLDVRITRQETELAEQQARIARLVDRWPVDGARLARLSTVTPEAVHFLWQGRVALAKLGVIDGDPGLGKSTITDDLAARVSTGARMPDGSPGIGPAGVVILSAEDGIADTIRPRCEAAGADLDRIAVLTIADGPYDRPAAIPDDLGHVEAAIGRLGALLVIVDPLMAHLPGHVNSYRDQDVRRALAPFAALAERTGAACLVVRHLTKAAGGSSLYRGGGSIGIVAAARTALLVALDPDDETGERRILAVNKSNLARHAPALSFTIAETILPGGIVTSRVRWGETTAHTAAQLLAVPVDGEDRGALGEAEVVLSTILASGPVAAKEVRVEARSAGVSDRTLDRAKVTLGVAVARVGGLGSAGRWEWALGPKNATIRLSTPVSEDGDLSDSVAYLGDPDDYPASAWDIDPEPVA